MLLVSFSFVDVLTPDHQNTNVELGEGLRCRQGDEGPSSRVTDEPLRTDGDNTHVSIDVVVAGSVKSSVSRTTKLDWWSSEV